MVGRFTNPVLFKRRISVHFYFRFLVNYIRHRHVILAFYRIDFDWPLAALLNGVQKRVLSMCYSHMILRSGRELTSWVRQIVMYIFSLSLSEADTFVLFHVNVYPGKDLSHFPKSTFHI